MALAQAVGAAEVRARRSAAEAALGEDRGRWAAVLDVLARQGLRLTRLAGASTVDAVTELPNRPAFRAALRRELARPGSTGTAVVLIDVEGLGELTDRLGSGARDERLRRVAHRCVAVLRDGDLAARVGGQEFALLLPDTGAAVARRVAARIQEAIEADPAGRRALSVRAGVAYRGPTGGSAAADPGRSFLAA